uniref:Sodefrin repeats A n=1 Tax=Adineta vaga TaxID=104782 RepID=B3VZZ2_ADIVA|nr:sodefrin precursor repeats A [Adineta vaga]
MKNHWILFILLLSIAPSTGLVCYKCYCQPANTTACDCGTIIDVEDGSHCTIVEDLHTSNPYIELSSAALNTSYVRIKDPYYIIVDEAIYYNETTTTWDKQTKHVVHGCDWDFCNKYEMIASLPQSFQLTIDASWLTDNIYGTGSTTSCNDCSTAICSNATHSIDYDQCPFKSCDNATTCSLYDLWHDVDTNELCYQSQCTPSEMVDEFNDANEKYKVQVEAIVYLAQNRSSFEIWELNINCAAENCTRPSIFQEVNELLSGVVSGIIDFPVTRPSTTPSPPSTTSTAPTNPLTCYNCSCIGTVCPCTTYEVISADDSYCSIIRQNYGQFTSIDFGHVVENSTHVYISEYPFVLAEESIIYDENTGRWDTQNDLVVFGCNTSLCNSPDLLYYLPNSFQMRLPEAWLNSSILGTGQSVRDCHECPDAPQCGTTDFLDPGRCPIKSCNTTCLVSDSFNDPANGLLCYQSFCAPEDSEIVHIDTHRVEIEGIVYANRASDLEIWEIDVYCRADDCSRPEIFTELRENLLYQPGDLTYLFNQSSGGKKLRCFDCYCEGGVDCVCETISIEDAGTTYCTLTRTYDGSNVYVYFQHADITDSYSNVRELPYVLVEEAILFDNQTGKWFTRTNEIIYACNVDYCNKPSLLTYLPTALEMTLPETWLNSSLMSNGQSELTCHVCPSGAICTEQGITNGSTCPIQTCNTTCFASNIYSDPENNEQCYVSYCVPDSSEFSVDYYRVEVIGIVYPSHPDKVELWETYVYCQVENCTRPEIFKEIENQLTVKQGNLSVFFNNTVVGNPGQLHCYDCYCVDDPVCACNKTLALPDNTTYCTIIREYDGQDTWIILEHIDQNSTRVYIREFPYMIVEESILYNEGTSLWITRPNLIIYGCNTDFCNDPRLVPSLPANFRMRLPDAWLNTNILGTGQPTRDCHECPEAPQCGTTDFLDPGRCPIKSCNTTCLVFDTFNDPSVDEQCYQSFCAPPDTEDYQIDTHRVEIEGIIYGNRVNAQLELWEVDLYCRADDCSRPEIFKELQAQLTVDQVDLSPFFNITTTQTTTTPTVTTTPTPPAEPQLACYECACYDNPNCTCDTVKVSGAYSSYCTIIRINYETHFTIDLEHIDRNSTRVYIRKFPFILAEESILQNETTGKWWIRSNIVIYGCNTSLCNHPSRVPLLPDSFKMTLSDEWLNTNVLGTGQPTRDCHECPDAPQCGTESFLDASRCPVKSCNTTCVVSDTFNNPDDDLLCYQSYCNPPDVDFEEDRHRVELEGIIYADNQNVVELWEIDVYCRADDCSRPEIFDELRGNLTTQTNNLSQIFNDSLVSIEPQRICYDCYYYHEPDWPCDKLTVADAKTSYCTLIRENYGDASAITLEHIDRNSTRVYIRTFPYLLVEESIIYSDTTAQWSTRTNIVVYGCNWDYCNEPKYIPHMPESFQMRLPDAWLNTNILGTGQPVRDCHECPDAAQCGTLDFLDPGRCPIEACNTTCLVSDLYSDPDTNEQCYQSFCGPPDSEIFSIDPHRIDMEGILYLDCIGRPVELWEIDLFCRADDCSRPTVFNEIREQFTVTIDDVAIFYPNTTTTLPSCTTTSRPTTSTVSASSTTRSSTATTSTSTRPGVSTTTATGSNTSSTSTSTRPGVSTTTATGSNTSSTGSVTTGRLTTTITGSVTTSSPTTGSPTTSRITNPPTTTSSSTSIHMTYNILIFCLFVLARIHF